MKITKCRDKDDADDDLCNNNSMEKHKLLSDLYIKKMGNHEVTSLKSLLHYLAVVVLLFIAYGSPLPRRQNLDEEMRNNKDFGKSLNLDDAH